MSNNVNSQLPTSGFQALDTPDTKRVYVRRLFATIADRYDLITVLLSFGLDRSWKRRLADLAGPLDGVRALDLACGTGDITFELANRGARVVGLDVTPRMIQLATEKIDDRQSSIRQSPITNRQSPISPRPDFIVADMMSLPFPHASFDIVTTGYGLRNVPVLAGAVAEIHRVLRPGGIALSLDFDRPSNAIVRSVYVAWLTVVGSALGYVLHRDPETYRYIPRSIVRYPGAAAVAELMRAHGFSEARAIPVLGGLMAIHTARK